MEKRRHALTGALWHASSLPESRSVIIDAGAVEPLVSRLEGWRSDTSAEEEDREERLVITALTLANLSMVYPRGCVCASLR